MRVQIKFTLKCELRKYWTIPTFGLRRPMGAIDSLLVYVLPL